MTQEIITELRNATIYQGERGDYWQKELQAREAAGQLNL